MIPSFRAKPVRPVTLRFAEILALSGERVHLGCLMAIGPDWVEVSFPERLKVATEVLVRFLPSQEAHAAEACWRAYDRIGFVYVGGGPSDEQFAGLVGLYDPRSKASRKAQHSLL